MAEVTQDKVPQKARDLYNKGFQSLERGNLDYAVDMLSACIELEPSFIQARRFLRAAEIRSYKQTKHGSLAHVVALLGNLSTVFTAFAALRSNNVSKALAATEQLLRADPLNHTFIRLFVRAAEAADIPDAAIQTLELVRETYPTDIPVINLLGALYLKVGRTKDARNCFEELVGLAPNNPDAIKMLKDAMALDSISSDGWGKAAEKGGYRDLIKDEKQATILEQRSKAVKTDEDADALIVDMQAKIKAEPGNVNYLRELARLYAQKRMFKEALGTLQQALDMNPGDPDLDSQLSTLRMQQYENDIVDLRAAGNEEAAVRKENERDQFAFDDLHQRVKRYPNDLKLRYELGVALYANDYHTEAIQQFQQSQRSPKQRILSLYYLALCFKKKNQLDLALDQLKKADSELPLMDGTKKDVMYEIGVIAEVMGDRKMAGDYFKRIYQVDIGYKDIAQKIEGIYRQKSP